MFKEEVYDFLRKIPTGKVVTYGQIAKELNRPNASRAVGNALHINPDTEKYPCYKVVNFKGQLAKCFKDGIDVQRKKLENEGIKVSDYTVDLCKYQWKTK